MTIDLEQLEEGVVPPGPPPPPAEEWKEDAQGRQYVGRKDGRPGRIIRQGEESIEQARERDTAGPKDRKPRRRSKTPKMAEAPKKADLKELEKLLAEALKAPAVLAGMAGDPWAADHFTRAGPYLARNLVLASENNPWLRRKLEEMATGSGDTLMIVISILPVISGMIMYVGPPIVYLFNLPMSDENRMRFGIPPRKEQPPPYAATAAQPESPPVSFAA